MQDQDGSVSSRAFGGNRIRHCLLLAVLFIAMGLAWAALSWADPGPVQPFSPSVSASYRPSMGTTELLTTTIFLPVLTNDSTPALVVDPQDRQASADFFNQVYRASEGVPAGWTGNHTTCTPGATSDAFRAAVQLRINYFRAMAGVSGDLELSDEYNRKAQQAALMMSVNRQLSHNPPDTWQCYTEEGAQAAGSSNLYLGVYGPSAISGYIMDPGSGNYFVGHRRWILYPQTRRMGTGDIPGTDSYPLSNALWVFDEGMWQPRPPTREPYVAWPPPGYVPYQVVFDRWSFAYAGADLAAASVEMSSGGQPIALTLQPVVNGYGENTLVWEPDLSFVFAPHADTAYAIVVRNVRIEGTLHDFVYQVTVFDPGSGDAVDTGPGDGNLGTPPRSD